MLCEMMPRGALLPHRKPARCQCTLSKGSDRLQARLLCRSLSHGQCRRRVRQHRSHMPLQIGHAMWLQRPRRMCALLSIPSSAMVPTYAWNLHHNPTFCPSARMS